MDMNVSLPPELADFVREKVSAGHYASSSEVIRQALRLMEKLEREDAERLASLRQAWREGVESGAADFVDFAELKAQARTSRDNAI
ncbi:MAG: type II toxin-antitoxin system ParD family antitoxin [Hyphomicrobiales bacterium]|nr:type II toxin-antitoxin system ParD family antitoxin [Hyphomicrobiales bacterium]MBV8663802.1 type II toxin-antitoxin system ParD family antitoxin [Hyphomicrobiales bacterium]